MGRGLFKNARGLSVVALIFFAAALALLALDFFGDTRLRWTKPATIGALAVGATLAWLGLRHLIAEGAGALDAERAKAEEATARAKAEIERERAAVEEERARRDELVRKNEEMKRWAYELRSRIQTLSHERGPLGATDDIPSMVLRIAVDLLGADKGLLLSRTDGDGDGGLDLLASEGFNNDPADSNVAQRFARTVIEKDRTIRENEPSHDAEATAADREIDNLVAIPIYMHDDFLGVVVVVNKDGGFGEHEDEVLLALGDHAGALLQNSRLRGDLRASYLATIRILANALEAKDPFLRGHSNDVSTYVAAVAEHLDLTGRKREELVFASLLHDLGKIGISERILLKPAALSPEEYNIVKLHPRIGYRLVDQVPALSGISTAVLYHHERWDGEGYPDGLRAEEIPIEARVIAVADAFSAMTSDRPYRGRMSMEEALGELERNAGTQFDAEVVRLFCEEMRARPPIEERASELEVALSDPQLVVRLDEDEPILGHGSHAVVDNLTLLYSHRYIHEMAKAEGERAAIQKVPFAVLMAQVANIDQINESEGYAAGDAAIRRLAQAVQRVAVTCGGTAARYSGSRCVLLMPRSSQEDAERCARELEASLEGAAQTFFEVTEWQPGESGAATLLRARASLAARSATTAP
jgi:diguanylate cyclase (GGDEF)-like protein